MVVRSSLTVLRKRLTAVRRSLRVVDRALADRPLPRGQELGQPLLPGSSAITRFSRESTVGFAPTLTGVRRARESRSTQRERQYRTISNSASISLGTWGAPSRTSSTLTSGLNIGMPSLFSPWTAACS